MKKVTEKGQTVEEAVRRAAEKLDATVDQLTVNVIQEPSKGFLGLRTKPAIIEAVLTETADHMADSPDSISEEEPESLTSEVEEASGRSESPPAVRIGVQFLEEILPLMGLKEVQVEVEEAEDHVRLVLTGKELGLVIGRRGQTLDALQYLTNVIANRKQDGYLRLIVDAENYRARRKKTLEQLADRLAQDVIRTRERIKLEPMNAAERKIIHTHLQNYAGVETVSEGEEPHRRIVLIPK